MASKCQRPLEPSVPSYWRHGADGRAGAVLSVAVGFDVLEGEECPGALIHRSQHAQVAGRPEAPVGHLQPRAALHDAELIVGASGRGEVALPRVIRPLQHHHLPHHLGDDEVEVRVALGVGVGDLVDGDAVEIEFDGRPLVGVEAAENNLLRVPETALVADDNSRRELERLGRGSADGGGECPELDLKVPGAEVLVPGAPDGDFLDGLLLGTRRHGRSGHRHHHRGARHGHRRGRRACVRGGFRGRLEAERNSNSSRDGRPVSSRWLESPTLHRLQRRGVEQRASTLHDFGRGDAALGVDGHEGGDRDARRLPLWVDGRRTVHDFRRNNFRHRRGGPQREAQQEESRKKSSDEVHRNGWGDAGHRMAGVVELRTEGLGEGTSARGLGEGVLGAGQDVHRLGPPVP